MPFKQSLPILPDDTPQQSILYRNLAAIAGFEAGELKNCLFDVRIDGSDQGVYVRKTEGYAAASDDVGSKACSGIYTYNRSDTTDDVFAVFNTDAYILSSGTLTAQSLTLTADKNAEFAQFGDDMYLFNGTDAVQKYNGTSWSVLSSGTPLSGAGNIARYAVSYRNMGVYANSTNNPNRVWISDVGDPETVAAANYWDFESPVTGIARLNGNIAVFTNTTIHLMSGYSPSSFVRTVDAKSNRYGCLSHRSIAEATVNGTNVLIFVSNDFVRAFDGQSTFRVGEEYLKNEYANINLQRLDQAVGIVKDNRYYLSVPWDADTNNSKVLVYDTRFNLWSRKDGWQASCMTTYNDDGVEMIYFGESSADSILWKYPSGTTVQRPADLTAINFQYTTRNIDYGEPFRVKKFKKLYLQTKAIGSVTMTVERNIDELGWSGLIFGGTDNTTVDLSTTGSVWGSFLWGDGVWGSISLVPTPKNRGIITGRGKIIKLRFTDTQTTDETEIYNIQPFFIPKKIK